MGRGGGVRCGGWGLVRGGMLRFGERIGNLWSGLSPSGPPVGDGGWWGILSLREQAAGRGTGGYAQVGHPQLTRPI